jgi:CubicO group peptidase (beta-lactamase class C family)
VTVFPVQKFFFLISEYPRRPEVIYYFNFFKHPFRPEIHKTLKSSKMKNTARFILQGMLQMLLLTCLIIPAQAQKPDKKLDAMILGQYPAGEPGATVLVARNGEVIFRKAYGMANLELDVPMKPEMVFEIGSITKQFTAVCILMLMEQGKLSLTDDITRFIKDYPTQGHTITIHQLLIHTSGIKDFTSVDDVMKKGRLDYSPAEIIDMFKNQPMDFAPGSKFQYNNSAYFLLGYIIEKASGMSYPEFLEKNIFQPLDMKNSYYGSQKKVIRNRAYGYQKDGDEFVNAEYVSMTNPYGAGAIMTNLDDLFKWNTALHECRLVSRESLDKAFTNYTLNNGDNIDYGYGWFLSRISGSPTYEHSGGIYGFRTFALYLPEEKVFVTMLSNRDDMGPGTLSTKIAAITIGKPFPEEKDTIHLAPDVLKKFAGTYVFEDSAIRYIILEEDKLYSQRKENPRYRIVPLTGQKFMYENDLATIEFTERSDGAMEAVFCSRGPSATGKRTSLEVPVKTEVEVPLELLREYTGEYELQPGFIIKIFLDDGKLTEQATGQAAFQIFPSSTTRFFLKVVEAEIEFLRNQDGKVDSLILYQNGKEFKGLKK